MRVAERVGEPGAQRTCIVAPGVVRFDDPLFAGFQRAVEIGRDDNVVGNESRRAERALEFRRKIDQHDLGVVRAAACLICAKLYVADEFDAGHQAKIEDQETASRLATSSDLTCWYSRLAEPKNK